MFLKELQYIIIVIILIIIIKHLSYILQKDTTLGWITALQYDCMIVCLFLI